jgi:hypothetical protein
MDQIHLPDPVFNDLSRLQKENMMLREELSRVCCRVEDIERGKNEAV